MPAERVELNASRLDASPTPSRTVVEQLRAGQADDHQRGAPYPGSDVFDEIEQPRLGPVDVLEDGKHRGFGRNRLDQAPECPGDLPVEALPAHGRFFAEADGEGQTLGHRRIGGDRPQLIEGLIAGHLGTDPGGRPGHLGHRPVGDRIAVGQATPAQDAGPFTLETSCEFADEPALADPRGTQHGEEDGLTLGSCPACGFLEQRNLFIATGQGGAQALHATGAADLVGRLQDTPGTDRILLSSELELADRFVADGTAGEGVDRGTYDDLARFRLLLEPGGQVERIPGRHGGAAKGVADHDLSRLHTEADAESDPVARARLLGECLGPFLDGDRGADRPLGIVLVSLLEAEDTEHGVAAELLDGAAVKVDLPGRHLEEASDQAAHHLRVEALAQAGRPDQVCEQGGDVPALLHPDPGGKSGTAGGAEAGVRGYLCVAIWTGGHACDLILQSPPL